MKVFRIHKDDDGYVLVTVMSICFMVVTIVAAITSITIADMVSVARNRGVIEARNSAESTMDTLYAVINRSNGEDLVDVAKKEFLSDDGSSPVSSDIEATQSSGGTFNSALVITQVYKWSPKYYSVDDDGLIHKCGLDTPDLNDDKLPCFKIRVSKVTTNPFGNSGGLKLISSGSNESDYQNANNTRTEYVVDVVVRHMCLQTQDNSNPKGCIFSRYQQKIRKRDFIQHAMMSQSEKVAPQVYTLISDGELQTRVENLDNAFASNDQVTGNVHTNDSHVYVCDGFQLTQNAGSRNWITSGFDSKSAPGAVTLSAASSSSNFSACNGSSGVAIARLSASRPKFAIPSRLGDSSGARLTSIAYAENPNNYVLSGNNIRIDFRYNKTGPTPDSTGMMHPVIDGVDKGWYPIPSNGVLSVDPNNGNGEVTVSGVIKGKLTIFSSGSIRIANSLVYWDTSMASDLLGLYANKDIILNCYNDLSPKTGQCDAKHVDGLLWAANQTIVESSPGVYSVSYQGTIYNDRWDTSTVSNYDNPPVLSIHGAVITYNRGTFGSIESIGAGRITSGWKKDIVYDSRLSSEQPPYMLRDGLATYVRSGVRDLACSTECT